jgi:hypothetical protein
MIVLDWSKFSEEIKFENRFFPRNNEVLRFIDEVFDKHIEVLKKGEKLYRARIIELSDANIQDENLIGFLEKDSMAPESKIAIAQRASPEKISYLYVAQDEYTALSETRPGILSFLSLAEAETLDELKIFDLWIDTNKSDMSSDFDGLAASFSAVIAEKEKGIDYLPMQFVAEYIKNKGADGIRYTSLQSQGGKNIVVFKKEKVRFLRSRILHNQNVFYSFLDLASPEKKPLVNNTERNILLPKDFTKHIKYAVSEIQSKKSKGNGG